MKVFLFKDFGFCFPSRRESGLSTFIFAQAGDLTDEMLYLFCVNSLGISKRLVLIQAKICAWKRCLKSSVKLAEA